MAEGRFKIARSKCIVCLFSISSFCSVLSVWLAGCVRFVSWCFGVLVIFVCIVCGTQRLSACPENFYSLGIVCMSGRCHLGI